MQRDRWTRGINLVRGVALRRGSTNLEGRQGPIPPDSETDRARMAAARDRDFGPELLAGGADGGIGTVLGNEERDRLVQTRREAAGSRIEPHADRAPIVEKAFQAFIHRLEPDPSVLARSCPIRPGERHLQPEAHVSAADGKIGIEGKGSDPCARKPGPVHQELETQRSDQQDVEHREGDPGATSGQVAGSRAVATSRRRVCSSRYPPPRKSSPSPMRLAERPILSITSEK